MTRIYSQALARDLLAIHVHQECTKTKMLKFVWVCIDGVEKVVSYHSEQEPFGYAAHDRLVDRE